MDAATDVMIDALGQVNAGPRPLVVWEETGALAASLAATGCTAEAWSRNANGARAGRPWPEPGPYTGAFVRMPKAKPALEMALDAVASVLSVGAPICLFGHNDEGIKSATRLFDVTCDQVVTLATRRHCRVMAGARRTVIREARGTLAAWQGTGSIAIAGEVRPWITYPGVFAGGAIDAGTRLLLDNLPPFIPGARILDFGSGTGVIAAAVLAASPATEVDLIEIDALAVAAASINVPGARQLQGDGLIAADGRQYSAILSNPPIHDGFAASRRVLDALIAEAPRYLLPGGELRLVVQRRVPVMDVLQRAFGAAEIIADDGRFTVVRAVGRKVKPRLSRRDGR